MIKALIFDNNGVLTTCDNDTTVPKFAKFFGVDAEYLRPIFHEVVEPADKGDITTEEFLSRLTDVVDKERKPEELRPILLSCYQPRPGMKELLSTLKKDYQIALLTNFIDCFDELNSTVWHYEGVFGEENLFVSSKLNLAKPDPEFYKYALSNLNCKPEESVFIDDRESNLVPARELGMETILFKTPEQFENELQLLIGAEIA